MIGYAESCLHINLIDNIVDLGKIDLVPSSLELESIHVHSHSDKSVLISDISIEGQNLNTNILGNIATTLSSQPNLGINSFGYITSKPVLRGYSGDRFLLMKEGMSTGDLSQSAIDHVITIDISEVNKIEIIRGPKSLIYESSSIGGIVNTKVYGNSKFRVDKFNKFFIFGGETFNKSSYGNLNLYIPINDKQINISASNRHSGDQTSPNKSLDNTSSNTSNYKLGFTKYGNKNYRNFVFENYEMNYGIPPSIEGHINGVDIKLYKKTFQFNYHHDIIFNGFNQFDVKYNFIDYSHGEFVKNEDYSTVKLGKRTHDFIVELKSLYSVIGSKCTFKEFIPSGFYWTPKTNEASLSIYGFNQIKLNHFDLLGSFRLEHLSIIPMLGEARFSNIDKDQVKNRHFQYLASSIGFKKHINNFEFNSWIMNSIKAPRVEELFSDGPHLGTYSYEIGEPNLKLEKIYGIENSILYNSTPFKISFTSFYNYSPYYFQMTKTGNCEEQFIVGESHPCSGADFIEWGSGSAGWLYKYQVEGVESVMRGAEVSLTYQYKNFKYIYDYSQVKGDNLLTDRPLSLINPTKEVFNIELSKGLIIYNTKFTKIHRQDRLGEFEEPTPSAFIVDFIFGYQLNQYNITLKCNNIFDSEYFNHLSKIKSIMPEAGRNISILCKFKL